jgi:hypothetical protein
MKASSSRAKGKRETASTEGTGTSDGLTPRKLGHPIVMRHVVEH